MDKKWITMTNKLLPILLMAILAIPFAGMANAQESSSVDFVKDGTYYTNQPIVFTCPEGQTHYVYNYNAVVKGDSTNPLVYTPTAISYDYHYHNCSGGDEQVNEKFYVIDRPISQHTPTPDTSADVNAAIDVAGSLLVTYKIGNIPTSSADLVGTVNTGDDTIPITIVFDLDAVDANTNPGTGAKITLTYNDNIITETLTFENDKVETSTSILKKSIDISSFEVTDGAIGVTIIGIGVDLDGTLVEDARFGSYSPTVNVIDTSNPICGYTVTT